MKKNPPKTKRQAYVTRHPLSLIVIALAVIVSLFLTMTTPQRLGPGGVTVFFVVIYLLSLGLLELIRGLTSRAGLLEGFWLRAYYAALPVALLGLSSLRQLMVVDIVVIIILTLVITLYHKRRAEGPSNLI